MGVYASLATGIAPMVLFSVLVMPALPTPQASLSQSSVSGEEWRTAFTVGKFLYSDPPKPDQIFKVQYRVWNGTLEKLTVGQTKVSSSGNGTLEIKFPRNYPYTNEDGTISPITVSPMAFFEAEPFHEVIDITYVDITDCFFIISIPFSGNKSIALTWSYLLWTKPRHGDDVSESCIPQTMVENVPTRKNGIITPLQQFKSGIAAEDAICPLRLDGEQDLMLLIGPNQKPYCVKWSNEGFMKRHGWTEPFQK